MEEVDVLGGGREVGRLEFPKTNLGSRIAGRRNKKMKPGKKNSEREENKKHEKN
jgi:hypothetical protein